MLGRHSARCHYPDLPDWTAERLQEELCHVDAEIRSAVAAPIADRRTYADILRALAMRERALLAEQARRAPLTGPVADGHSRPTVPRSTPRPTGRRGRLGRV
jgi:hypothetical protein